ncbi:Tetratricopeptide-like helical domain containing protein [Trema orientale]|uniref:Tetratricopeptide-like helical domain containing protein n=1 Tax=Trema orientale TaxID=63057 RepID=A0A2P5E8I9_TREOI|nr:Tetratricopeptide-like helical domain containing protein [Trema orientale]
MASSIFTIIKRYGSLTVNRFAVRPFCTESPTGNRRRSRKNLFSRISPLGLPSISVVPVLDQWVQEGRSVPPYDLRTIVRELRSRRRYKHALEVSEWMSSKGRCPFTPADYAVQLDLIGKVRGLDSAESYFDSLSDEVKIHKLYGALLNCYVREGLIDKSLSHMQKMKELGFASSPLSYNDIMCLYTQSGLLDKIPDVMTEMKKDGVNPDKFSYRVCINSYGLRSDLNRMEKLLEEMESQSHISLDWRTYSMVANFYIKAGAREKALIFLKKCEELVDGDALGYNHLISLHASLGHKDQMMRLWDLQKAKCKKQINRDYITILGLLVKLGEFEEAEVLLKGWESSHQFYDFRVPNILLLGYCKKGLIEKAEAMLRNIVERGRTPTPNSWAIIAAGYLNRQNMETAFECMKEALAVQAENKLWRPKAQVMSAILGWLADNGDIEDVKAFVSSLRTVIPVNRDMYHALIKAHIRVEKELNWVLESMKNDNIDVNEETEKILSSSGK